MFEVSVEYTFAAGHSLRNYRGKCENVHGHNYRVRITVEGEQLNSIGLLVDFVELKKGMRACRRPAGPSIHQRSGAVHHLESFRRKHGEVLLRRVEYDGAGGDRSGAGSDR